MAAATIPDRLGLAVIATNDRLQLIRSAVNTAIVFVAVDHAPFPEEGIESTVWGSDSCDIANFPTGWTLATLTTIYAKGWEDPVGCQGQDNADSLPRSRPSCSQQERLEHLRCRMSFRSRGGRSTRPRGPQSSGHGLLRSEPRRPAVVSPSAAWTWSHSRSPQGARRGARSMDGGT